MKELVNILDVQRLISGYTTYYTVILCYLLYFADRKCLVFIVRLYIV